MSDTKYFKSTVVSFIEDPDSGKVKKKRENYIVEAEDPEGAIAATVKYIKEHAMFSYDFDITGVKEENITDIIFEK